MLVGRQVGVEETILGLADQG